jgi:hypothetical protein
MKLLLVPLTLLSLLFCGAAVNAHLPIPLQQNSAKTDLPGKGPCTNFPSRYQKLEVRMAWFYGCMHEDPPTVEEIKARIAALSPKARKALEGKDFVTREALLGVSRYDLPIQVFPE